MKINPTIEAKLVEHLEYCKSNVLYAALDYANYSTETHFDVLLYAVKKFKVAEDDLEDLYQGDYQDPHAYLVET